MKKHLLLSLTALLLVFASPLVSDNSAYAQIVLYSFTGSAGDEVTLPPDAQPTNATASDISRGSGVSGSTSGGTFSSSGWSTGALLTVDYYEITLTPSSGFALNLTSLVFDERRSGTGIRDWEVRSSLDSYGASLGGGNVPDNTSTRTQTVTLGASFTGLASAVTFRIYGYNAEAAGGTWRVDNVNINGTITATSSTPTVNLSATANTGSEASSTYFTLTATASAAVTGAQTVDVGLSGTGLTSGDFRLDPDGAGPTPPSAITFPYQLTIANGQTTASLGLMVFDDALNEGPETATFTISNESAGITLGSTTTQDFDITDNDAPVIVATPTSLTGFSTPQGTPSASQTFTLEGDNLSGNLSIAALTGFEYSLDNSTFTSTLTVPVAGGNVTGEPRTIYVRLTGASIGTPSGNAVVSGGGATSVNVALDGTVTSPPAAPCADLFISEYVEGSGNNKYIEIYNPTASAINLATGNYSLRIYANGSTIPSDNALTGTIAAYGVLVFQNSSATIYSGPPAPVNNNSVNFNGDDAIALTKNSVDIDIFGRIGNDPGSEWSLGGNNTSDQTLVRNAAVQAGIDVSPTGTGSGAFTTLATEWTEFVIDNVSNLGSHTCDCFVNLPVVTLATNLTAGTEAAATAFVLTATADVAVTGNQTVNVVLSGTGLTSTDFTGANFAGTVQITILSGNTTGTLNLAVNDDASVEPLETATFTIGTPSAGVVIGTPAAVNFAITDNDNLVSSLSVVDGNGSEAASISSLTNGTITTSAQGTEVWQFRLYDGNGVSNDADTKPTVYQQWILRPGTGNTVPDWDAAISNIKFFQDGSGTPIPGSFLVNASSISFLPSTPITVADGGSALISMRITLENSLPAGSDGKRFVFKVVPADVTVDTDVLLYSQLGTFSEESSASMNPISILATLQFINAPTTVGLGDNFTITVSAVDANGNIDTDNTSSITLAQNTGTGTMTGGSTVNLVGGTYTWTGLSHDTEEVFQVIASGGSFSPITANINVVDADYQIFDHFNRADNNTVGVPSSETSATYTELGTGDGSRQRISNNQLLLSNCNSDGLNSGNGYERVSFNMSNRYETTYNDAGGVLNWKFNMRCTRPSPSGFPGTANVYASAVILGSSQSDFANASASGYAVIIGNQGSPDPVKLIRFAGGLNAEANVTDVAVSSQTGETNYFSVNVSFDPCTGLWSLWVRNDGGSFVDPTTGAMGTAVTATNTTHTATDLIYSGFAFQHGSSCSEFLLIDNFNIPNATTASTSAKEWNGSISADWNVAGNWGPCPGVPTNTDNVIIPNVVTQPIISAASPAATCQNLTVNAGADLTINASRFLNVWGNVVNNGTAAFGAGTLTMEGTGTLTLTGNVNVANYHVSTNVTLNGTVTVSGTARSETGGVLASNGNLVLLNGAQLLHGVGTTNGGGSVTGNIVVKRQGNSSGGFNGWSTPVVGGTLPGSSGYSYNSSLGTNSNADDNNPNPDPGWVAHSGAMTPGKGYFSVNGGLATFTGAANNAGYSPIVTGSAQGLGSTVAPTFFNLIGNPYPSAISANQFINDNSARIDGTIYFWADANAGPTAYSQNDYATYTLNGGVPTVAGGSGPVPNGSIPSCQGFFVNCDATGPINFNNGQRGGNNSQFFRMAAPDAQRLWLSINNTNLELFNQTLVAFDELATDQKDWGMDAYKLRGNQEISIGAQQDGETYVIATYEPIPQSGKVVPLMTYAETAGTYTFVADSMTGFENHTVYLEDLSNGSLYPLEQGNSYSFAMTNADEYGRFQLWFSPLTITGVNEVNNDLRIYSTNDMVVVEHSSGESIKGFVQITDMAGRIVLSNDLSITNGIGRLQTANLANGIYAVSFVSINGNKSTAQKVTLGQ
ncbi:MAG: lamin tail domain-containing protein [Flavobacteriales bacterium]|nr:lamin tail domain-containing protein [Flavobacteriales bacterium]